MELDRRYIERRDFPASRRGYDPDEVDRHLGMIAEAVEQLKASRAARPVEEIRAEPVDVPGPPDAESEVVEEAVEQAREAGGNGGRANEGARLIALNMALSGTPREETARYLRENFDLENQDDLLDEVYARAGS